MRMENTEIIREAKTKAQVTREATAKKRRAVAGGGCWCKENKAREQRIAEEIVVDAYNAEERAMGWYCYLEGKLQFPFKAKCSKVRAISPLERGDEVAVKGMAPESECEREMFVTIQWGKRALAVPLSQLEVIDGDNGTKEAVEDWRYWVGRGYQ